MTGQRSKDEEIYRLRRKLRGMRRQVRDQQRAILLRNAAILKLQALCDGAFV